MRYKNLTITITLGCLSIVALAGLVMLPITDVISCSDSDRSDQAWYLSPDNRTVSFSANHKYPDNLNNLGWSVKAELRVSIDGGYGSAFAKATPSIVDPDRIVGLWEADSKKVSHTFYGNATVTAAVYPANFDPKDRKLYEDTDLPKTSLSANVQVKTQRYAICYLESESGNTSKSVNLEFTVGAEMPAGVTKIKVEGKTGYQYIDERGRVWSVTITDTTTGKIHDLGFVVDRTASKTGGSDWRSAYARITSFSMEACNFTEKQLSFSTRDCTLEELGITRYRDLYNY